jgi:hypothetical protein
MGQALAELVLIKTVFGNLALVKGVLLSVALVMDKVTGGKMHLLKLCSLGTLQPSKEITQLP